MMNFMLHEILKLKARNLSVLIPLLFFGGQVLSQSKTDSLLQELNAIIKNKDVYVKVKLDRIEKLKHQLSNRPEITKEDQFELYNKLYHEYKVFVYDSAFKYAQKLSRISYQLNDPTKINYARLKLSFILMSSGMHKESFDSLKTIKPQTFPDSSKLDFYAIMGRSYDDLGHYNNDQFYKQAYITTSLLYLDSALKFCEPNTYSYFYISNYKDMLSGNANKALAEVNYLLQKLIITDHQRAINNHHQGRLYLEKGEKDKALESFIVSSICDIKAAIKENAALNSVADLLYKKGEVKIAYGFIEEAMKDALYYGAKQRKIEIGSILPIIAAEELRFVESQRMALLLYSAALTVLGILVLIFLFIIVRQVKKLKAAEIIIKDVNHNLNEINHQLREADKIKEVYIGYYFNINSNYINKIEDVLKAIDQKLVAKKYEDIRFIINNINLKRERDELFVNFDKVFLKLFPDFINIYNSYFHEEDKIILKDNQLLNTELRIFALIRMGINDTEKIAKLLDYSVNTIYTYKTKVKSKSILPNEEFEKRIMEIMTV